MKTFFALLRKDLLLELRSRETITLLCTLSLIFSVIIASGAEQSLLPTETLRKLFPTLLWCGLVFGATLAVGRGYEHEFENLGMEGLILAGVRPGLIYASKVCSNFFMVISGHLIMFGLLAILLNIPVFNLLPQIGIISALVLFAYASLVTLASAISGLSRLKGLLLPVILLPLLFPLLFAAISLTQQVMIAGVLDPESVWFSLLIGLDVVYFVLGLNLYEFVIRE